MDYECEVLAEVSLLLRGNEGVCLRVLQIVCVEYAQNSGVR